VGGFGKFDATATICVGYLQTTILMMSKQFDNGGWLISTIAMIVSCLIMIFGSHYLLDCAMRLGVYNYGEIVGRTFG